MRLAFINDTSGHRNWGCGATSAGLRRIVERAFPGADIDPFPAETLWPSDRRWLRGLRDRAISSALAHPGPDKLGKAMSRFGFDVARLAKSQVAVFNGEGMIHDRSGYAIRLVGAMALASRLGLRVIATNHTVDAAPGGRLAQAVAAVYPTLDRVYVRETASFDALRALGVGNATLVADAAFVAPAPSTEAAAAACAALALPSRFVAVTGSSALKPRRDRAVFTRFCATLREGFGLPLVALASTRTDLRLAQATAAAGADLRIIDDSISWSDVMAVIARAEVLAGGRFHSMIFATRAGVPILPMGGNTHKNAGLADLLEYPIVSPAWNDAAALTAAVDRIRREPAELGARLATSAAKLGAGLDTLDLA